VSVSFWVSIDEGVPLRKNGISGDNRFMIRAFETCVYPIVEHDSVEMWNWTIIEKLQRRFTKTLNGVNKSSSSTKPEVHNVGLRQLDYRPWRQLEKC